MTSLQPSASDSISPQPPAQKKARDDDSQPQPQPLQPSSANQSKPKPSASSEAAAAASPRPSVASASAGQKRAREVNSDSDEKSDAAPSSEDQAAAADDESQQRNAASGEEAECKPAAAAAGVSSAAKVTAEEADLAIPKNVIGLRRLPALLSAAECVHLISISAGRFFRSMTGGGVNPIRTSYSSTFSRTRDATTRDVAAKVAAAVGVTQDKIQGYYVVRYEPGQHYQPHVDSTLYDPPLRRASMVVYLNDVAEGGETHFTELDIRVKPKCGDGIVWNNHAHARTNYYPESEHQGLPPKSGLKYILSVFIEF